MTGVQTCALPILFALIGLSLLDGDVRAVMWWAIVPAIGSVLLTFLVREVRPAPTAGASTDAVATHDQPLPRGFWRAAAPLIAVQAVNLPDTLLLLRLSQLGASTTHVVLAYIAFNTVYTLAAYPAGVIAATLPPTRVYAIGLGAFAIAYTGIGLVGTAGIAAYVLVAVYGLFPALTDGIGKSIVAHAAPRAIHGKAQGEIGRAHV